jgi:hypothetical protein
MRPSPWTGVPLLATVLLACGGTTAQPAAGPDAGADALPGDDAGGAVDAPLDAPGYLACMNASGQVDPSLKACQIDADCVIEQEQTDCCGTILYVGISTAMAAAFTACEASWLAHFPACGCDSNQTKTEDGKASYGYADAAAPQVHCAAGGVCMTYRP